MNFERGLDPKKSMDIGIKVYRCGHCGNLTTDDGVPLPYNSEEFKQAQKIIDEIGDSKTELVHGDCCIEEDMPFHRMQVTRDMALDAQDPSLEGTWI